jgi:DNA helicase-2/ATP-dependent DNA helicase PcrA
MTLHAAKGREFPVVFITGCEDGIQPLARGGTNSDLVEERRLMYVGLTRASERLYLTRARMHRLYGMTSDNPPSRFLDGIPLDCFRSDLLQDAAEYGRRPWIAMHRSTRRTR